MLESMNITHRSGLNLTQHVLDVARWRMYAHCLVERPPFFRGRPPRRVIFGGT